MVDPEKAIAEVWKEMEEEMITIFRKKWKEKLAVAKKEGNELDGAQVIKKFPRDGSTAIVCLIVNNTCYFANVGDSLAVVFHKASSKKGYTTYADVHDPVGPEKDRIEKSGGTVKVFEKEVRAFPMFWKKKKIKSGKNRAYPGGLLVSRAFGDFHGKLEEIGGIKNGIIVDYTQIRKVDIDSDWENLVIASDGVWDPFVKTTKQINQILTDQFNAIELFGADGVSPPHDKKKFIAAVEALCMDAVEHKYWLETCGLEGDGADNTTAICIRIGKAK
jgi:serine/threonine protein phosphatase PrpC